MLAIVASAAASAGAFGTFTSTKTDSNSFTSGTAVIALGAHGAATNLLNVDATNIAPGDTIERPVDLANTGSLDLSDISLTTTASPTTLLDTDVTNGLQMQIDNCDQAWTQAGTTPGFTYTCGGSSSAALVSSPVIGASRSLSNLLALTSGASDHLLVTMTLPSTADNTFQNLSSTITYSFTGTQRTATNR